MKSSWIRSILLTSLWILFFATCADPKPPAPQVQDQDTKEVAMEQTNVKLDLWQGVEPLEPEQGDYATKFVPPQGPKPPPELRKTVGLEFPPSTSEVPTKDSQKEPGPLEVLRFQPSGEQELVDSVSVVFNQPMVPLAGVEELRGQSSALVIEPLPKGQFRWLGTQLLSFEADGRMPFSTTYQVRVPAEIQSTLGVKLDKEVQWSFTTPALELVTSTPSDKSTSIGVNSAIELFFNQTIDKKLLAQKIQITGGGKSILFNIAEVHQDATKFPQRAIKLVPNEPLAANTSYRLALPAGVYGEGPNASKAISLQFRTFEPLKLFGPDCRNWDCNPGYQVRLHANNELRAQDLKEKVHVEPEVADLKIETIGTQIVLSGNFAGDTAYTLTVDPGVLDVHGQSLERSYKKRIKMPSLEPSLLLSAGHRDPAVLELSHSKQLDFTVSGLQTVEVRAHRFSAKELSLVLGRSTDYINFTERSWPQRLPEPSFRQDYDVRESQKLPYTLHVDLSSLFTQPGTIVFLTVRSNEFKRWGSRQRLGLQQIALSTNLGISAAIGNDRGVVLLTNLETGEALANGDIKLFDHEARSELWQGQTNEQGFAEIKLANPVRGNWALLQAKHGGDLSYVPLRQDLHGNWFGYGGYSTEEQAPRVFFYTDREPYKPGDTIHVSGIVRKETKGPQGKVEAWSSTSSSANYRVFGPRGHQITEGDVKISPWGTFSVEFATKPEDDTGYYRFDLSFDSLLSNQTRNFSHSFAVESYRTPEFQVEVGRVESTPLMFGDTLTAFIKGSYFHGAALVGAEVNYTLQRQNLGFRPPGAENENFAFGPEKTFHFSRHLWNAPEPSIFVKQDRGVLDQQGKLEVKHTLSHKDNVVQADENPPPIDLPQPFAPSPDSDENRHEQKHLPEAATYTLEAQVVDENRQAIAGRASFVVHPAEYYVGLRSDRKVYKEGEQARVESIAVDVQGKRIAEQTIGLEIFREETIRKAVKKGKNWVYEYEQKLHSAGSCQVQSARSPEPCLFQLGQAGTYVVHANVRDSASRENLTTMRLYVHGKDAVIWQEDDRRVDLVPDHSSYKPGDTATILIRSSFEQARGLLVTEREGIFDYQPLTVQGGSAVVNLPISETMIPNIHVSALLVRGRVNIPGIDAGQDLGRPVVAVGRISLPVSSDAKRIVVELLPAKTEIAPGEALKLTVRTKTQTGTPTKAAVAVMVVDEGVLSLMNYATPDPLNFFHHHQEPGVGEFDLRSYLLPKSPLVEPQQPLGLGGYGRGAGGGGLVGAVSETKMANGHAMRAGKAAPLRREADMPSAAMPMEERNLEREFSDSAAGLDANQAMANPIDLRTLFATTAYFNPEINTNEQGQAEIEIPMPENLTTFRIMAVAVDPQVADRFGSADTQVRVRKAIMLRPSFPRFANFGDEFEGSVMVDNQSEQAQAILVGVRGLNVHFPGLTQKQITVPAGESQEVRFPVKVDQAGNMRLQFAALSNVGRDATEISLPVNLPTTRQAFADYGVSEGNIARTIKVPEKVLPGYGGMEVSMSSTALHGLEDSVRYLIDYPYECTEQTASRLLPIFVLGPVLNEFPIASLADKAKRDALASEGITRLTKRQNHDGGFRYWDSPGKSSPYLSAWATLALQEGRKAGYKVDEKVLLQASAYLEAALQRSEKDPRGFSYDWSSRAFALWILANEGRGQKFFDRVWTQRSKLPLFARALLMSTAHKLGRQSNRDQLAQEFRQNVQETARTAHFIANTTEADAAGLQLLMHSDVQGDAAALMAFLEMAPEEPLLAKVIAGIMDDRDAKKSGRWLTTHANAWVLLAASRYFTAVEKQEPNFITRLWLDEQFAGEQRFQGRSMSIFQQSVPMDFLQKAAPQSLLLSKDGPGKLYYRLGLRYSPATLKTRQENQGFTVERSYEALAQGQEKVDPEAVQRLPNGDWQIKAGTMVRVRLTLIAHDRENFVVVDDPLPAGLEGVNERFATSLQNVSGGLTQTDVDDGEEVKPWYRYGFWWRFDHTELRDDRMLLFADSLPAGVYTYSYTARATNLGTFQLPPIHAEAMYAPERFGHSASSTVIIVE